MKRLLFFTCILVFLGLKAQDDIMAKKNEQVGDSLSIFTRINADSSTVSHQNQPQIIEDHTFARINITDLIKSEKITWYYTSSIKSLDEQVSPTDKEEPEEKNPTEYADPEMGLDTGLKKKNLAALFLINEYVIAKLYLLKQIGYNITSEIGDRLNLDIVEITGGGNWKSNSILFGKNLTRNLFLSYQRKLAFGQSSKLPDDKFALEYRFNRHFSILATHGKEKYTGLDLFWKFGRK